MIIKMMNRLDQRANNITSNKKYYIKNEISIIKSK